MNIRCFLAIGLSVVTLSQAMGGFVAKDTPKPNAPAPQTPGNIEHEKAMLARLIEELDRSARSFMYLRSIGFTQTDEEFEALIGRNNTIFEFTRTMRFDAQGNRQVPGWPAIRLTAEYKRQLH